MPIARSADCAGHHRGFGRGKAAGFVRRLDDKSGFLRLAGYEAHHDSRLLDDIRAMLSLDAERIEVSEYAEKFAIHGTLAGPNGRSLQVRSIWAKIHSTGEVRFVTLYPSSR